MRKLKTLRGKRVLFGLAFLLILTFLVLLIPLDRFAHGFYSTPPEPDAIAEEDKLGLLSLEDGPCRLAFTPQRSHFAGFELLFTDLPEEPSGFIVLRTYTEDGAPVEALELAMDRLQELSWFVAKTASPYRKGVSYLLEIAGEGGTAYPSLVRSVPAHLSDESRDSDVLIAFGYAQPTFTYLEKALFLLAAVSVLVLLFGELVLTESNRRVVRTAALFLALTTLFSWTYTFNSFDVKNRERFSEFQSTSETLVTGVIRAQRAGLALNEYGLGRYYDVLNKMFWTYSAVFRTDETWTEGYHREAPKICLWNSPYTEEVVKVGHSVRFSDGQEYAITALEFEPEEREAEDYWLQITLDAPGPLDPLKSGTLQDIRFADSQGRLLPVGRLEAYISQYGLQGKVFLFLSRFFGNAYLDAGRLLCALAAAAVFSLIVLLLWKKYDGLLAACFGAVFLLSPWVVNFARNLYWLEFTWFLPMLIGLICAIWLSRRWVRLCCYAAAFAAVFLKSLCGYEYLTVILLAMIAFLLADWFLALRRGEKEKARLLFRAVFCLGVCSVLGFLAALLIHAGLRGQGDLGAGIKSILETDVLRRVAGGSLNDFEAKLAPSLNASVWEVFKRYFHFDTEIIVGVSGSLFPTLCLLPLLIFIYDFCKKQLDPEQPLLYAIFFVTCISWFVLAKSHSYIHPHISFVLWYFGFVQICFYVIAKKILTFYGAKRGGKR